MGITVVTGRGGKGYIAVPACGGSLAEAKRAWNQTSHSMDTETETGHATEEVLKCTPVMIGEFFTVEVSSMVRIKLPPVGQVTRPEIHNQLTRVYRPFMADKRCEVQQEGFLALREMFAWKTFGGDDCCNGQENHRSVYRLWTS
eukprot:582283-Pelagomonas_calceolata.AAC.2